MRACRGRGVSIGDENRLPQDTETRGPPQPSSVVKERYHETFNLPPSHSSVGLRRIGRPVAADPLGRGIRLLRSAKWHPTGRSLASAVLMALGLALGGWFIGHGFASGRASDRFVEVKGLAEREVTADLALWSLRYVSTGDDLTAAQAQITRGTRQGFAFLSRNGIDTIAVQLQALEVSDAFANRFPGERAGPRYVIQQTVMVRSGNRT